MPTAPAQQPPPDTATETAAQAAIVTILLARLTPTERAQALRVPFAELGFSEATIAILLGYAARPLNQPKGREAAAWATRTGVAYRAMYLVEAGKRVEATGDAGTEGRHFASHLNAQRLRDETAEGIDEAHDRYGPVLGWWSKRDNRVTPACRVLDGNNFSALQPPEGGWPGTLHFGSCRCKPGPPFQGGDRVEDMYAQGLVPVEHDH